MDDVSGRACPRLWSSSFIDRDGEVYACCHYLPASMGNLTEQTLAEIRAGPRATEMRREALAAGTPCLPRCSLLSTEERRPAVELDPERPSDLERLHVLFGEGCRLDCIMCHQDHRDPTMLAASLVLTHAAPEAGTYIEVQGGEPLQLKESRAYLRELIRCGFRPTVITNGLFLRGDLGRTVVEGCGRIKVSLNAATKATHEVVNRGSSWRTVIGNLREAVAVRNGSPRAAKIIGHMTLLVENLSEAPDFIALCADLDLDGVEFGFDARNLPRRLAGSSVQDRAILSDKLRAAIALHGSRLAISDLRLHHLGLL